MDEIQKTPIRYKAVIAYDGSDFSGWQSQPGERTVQETVEDAVARLSPDGVRVQVYASGRTDAGVHARGQCVHFDLPRVIDGPRLRRALNWWLPRDVRVMDVCRAERNFHARHSALGKEYRYRVYNAEVMDPVYDRTHLHISRELDAAAMRDAAEMFIGEHDFAAFSANPSREVGSTVRTIFSLELVESSPFYEIRVSGNGFLYKMVRSISGILLSVGIGKEKPEAILEIMKSRVRTARVETAPARGLILWHVWYDDSETPRRADLPLTFI